MLPEHHVVLGDLLTARARGILAQFPTAQHQAKANPRAIRCAAADAGARGFSLDDAPGVRDSARGSLYGWRESSRHSVLYDQCHAQKLGDVDPRPLELGESWRPGRSFGARKELSLRLCGHICLSFRVVSQSRRTRP